MAGDRVCHRLVACVALAFSVAQTVQGQFVVSPLIKDGVHQGKFSLKDNDGVQVMGVALEKPPTQPLEMQLSGPDAINFDKCKLFFDQENWNTTQYVNVVGRSVFSQPSNNHQDYVISIRTVVDQTVNTVHTMDVKVTREIEAGAQCRSTGDPHLMTFDGRLFDLQLQGSFYLLKAPEIVIQVEQTPCNRRVSCNSAIAVMYRTSVVIVSINTDNPIVSTMFRANVNETELSVTRTNNDRNYLLRLDNGGTVRIDTRDWNRGRHANVWVRLPNTYFGDTLGLCGIFDGNRQNDFTLRGNEGLTTSSINAFGESWRVREDESLFLLCKSDDNCLIDEVRQNVNTKFIRTATEICRINTEISTMEIVSSGFRLARGDDLLVYSRSNQFVSARDSNKVFSEFQINDAYRSTVSKYCKSVVTQPKCDDFVSFELAQGLSSECVTDTLSTGLLDGIEDVRLAYMNECYMKMGAKLEELETDDDNKDEYDKLKKVYESLGFGKADCSAYSDCSGKGECNEFGCQCNQGFTGFECELSLEAIPQPGKVETDGLPSTAAVQLPMMAMTLVAALVGAFAFMY